MSELRHYMQAAVNRVYELEDMGSVTDIRQWLRQRNAVGEIDNMNHCVLANAIRGDLPEQLIEVEVRGDQITLEGISEPFIRMEFETTEAIYEFVDNFDSGHYPELVDRQLIQGCNANLIILDEVFPVTKENGLQLKQVIDNNRTQEVLGNVR